MSIFRNRSSQSPSSIRLTEERENEPRLFSGQSPQEESEWDYLPEFQSAQFKKSHIYRQGADDNEPFVPPRTRSMEGQHPRDLSFRQENRLYEEESSSRFGSPLRFVLIMASLIIIATFAWLSIRWLTTSQDANPPVLYAEPGPYKIRPDHPGGLQVPHQDRLVYNRISPGEVAAPERLLPGPEQPLPPPPPTHNTFGPPQNYAGDYAPPPPASYGPPNESQRPETQGHPYSVYQNSPSETGAVRGTGPQGYGQYPSQDTSGSQQNFPVGAPIQGSASNPSYGYPSTAQESTPLSSSHPSDIRRETQQDYISQGHPGYAYPSSSGGSPGGRDHRGYPLAQQPGSLRPSEQPAQVSSYAASPSRNKDPNNEQNNPQNAGASKMAPFVKKASTIDELIEEDIHVSSKSPHPEERNVSSPQTLSAKTYRIQVATLKDKQSAQRELLRIQRTYPELVGKMIPQVERFNGMIHRVLFGPFSKKENASARCGKFRAQGFSCIVLNPSP